MTMRAGRRRLLLGVLGVLAAAVPAWSADAGTFRAVMQENGAAVELGQVRLDANGRLLVTQAGRGPTGGGRWWRG